MAPETQKTPSSPSPVRTLPPNVAAQQAAAQAAKPASPPRAPDFSGVPFWAGIGLSFLWISVVVLAIFKSGVSQNFAGLPLINWALGISAITSPIALIWMVTAYLQRAADVQSVAEPLRRQLMMITGESGAAEVRIRRFNQAIREQLELLKSTQNLNRDDLMGILERVRAHKGELEQFETNSVHHVKEIQDVIRRSMQYIEKLMDDKFTMLRVLDTKLVQSSDNVARQTDTVREQLSTMLEDIEANTQIVASTIEKSLKDSRKLADTARAQEASIIGAAESASTTLFELSGKIDLNIARFLERANTARNEAEHLANALDSQSRSLDEFSSHLPARVSEAENILRGVADRLYASEQLAREQAVKLSDQLSERIDGLQTVMDRFVTRMDDIDGTFKQRQIDLDGLVVRVSGASNDLAQQISDTIDGLGDRADHSLRKYENIGIEARRGVEDMAQHLEETAAKYEAATRDLVGLSTANSAQLRAMSSDVAAQLGQFQALQKASQQASEEVQHRAAAALQNMQHVLERLLATRDATQSVGETLTGKLRQAVEENESIITRINEAAGMTVRALGIATESLGVQEMAIADQAKEAEISLASTAKALYRQADDATEKLRTQNTVLAQILEDAEEKLLATDRKLGDFAQRAIVPVQNAFQQIEASTQQGSATLDRYCETVQGKITLLQDINARVNIMGDHVAETTSEALSSLESLNTRFLAARTAQEESTRVTLEQFNSMAERLQREVGTLNVAADGAVSNLQQATTKVSAQTQQIQRDTQESAAQIQVVTSSLQNEAAQIRSVLQKQADDLAHDLARAERQFTMLGEQLKQRTDAAYGMLDRMADHYNQLTRAASDEFETRAHKLELTATQATGKVQELSNDIQGQISLITGSTVQLENNAGQIAASSNRALQQLSTLNEKLTVVNESSATVTQQVVTRLEEASQAFGRQTNGLGEAAQNAIAAVQRSGASYGEQATRLIDSSHQVEQNIRNLAASTGTYAEQSSQLRATMEQQSHRLAVQLEETVGNLEISSRKLEQVTATAAMGADQVAERYQNMSQQATDTVAKASEQLVELAGKTESSLSSLGTTITQQTATLVMLGEQLGEQHTQLIASNENQRTQLVDLFDKLGAAHGEASSVAERSIARLNDSIQQIHRQLGQLSDHSQATLGNVRNASSGFADQSALLIQQAQQAEQQARTVLSVTAALQDQAKQLREALHGETERSTDLLAGLLGKLNNGTAELRNLGVTADAVLNNVHNSAVQQTTALNASIQQISDRQRSLTTTLDAQRDVLNGLLSRLNAAQDEVAISAERNVQRLGDSTQQVTRQMETMENQANSTQTSVRNAITAFTEESSRLDQHIASTEQGARMLVGVSAELASQAQKLQEGVQRDGEATTATLGTLISKVASGAEGLQKSSGVIEQSLGSLGAAISHQASSLHTTMDQLDNRQQSLTSALTEQRETIGGLVTRLSVAQDEIATTAERSVTRLHDNSAQLSRQVQALDAQAQSTISNVRTAATSFADEASALSLQALQSEQQVRNMLAITSEMYEKARVLREGMQEQSTAAINQIGSYVAKLEATAEDVRQQSNKAIHSMDQSALSFDVIAKKGGEALDTSVQNLNQAAMSAEMRLSDAAEKVRLHTRTVMDSGEQAENQARQLADSAEYATSRLVTLRSTMAEADRDGRDILAQAGVRIAEVKSTLQQELEQVAEISRQAVQQVALAGELLATQSDALRANVAMSESAIKEAADMVRAETIQLPAVLSRSATQINDSISTYKAQTGELNAVMLGNADRFINVAAATRDTINDEMQDLSEVASKAEATLREFNITLAAQINAIRSGTGELTTEQLALVEQSNRHISSLTAAGERLAKIRTEAADTAEKMAQELMAIDTAATNTTGRLQQVSENLARQTGVMAEQADRAEGQITGATQNFRDQLERIRSGVQMQIDDINRGLLQITAQLERTGTTLRSTTAGTVTDVEKIAVRFDQTSKESIHQLTDRTARMRVATEEVATLLSGFGDQIEGLLNRLATAGDGIKQNEHDLVSQLSTALSHLSGIVEKLDASRQLATTVSAETHQKLGNVAAEVETQIRNLAAGSETVTNIVRGVGTMYVDQTQGVTRGVIDAQSQVLVMNKSLEEMQQRTDRMRVALKLQADELLGSLEQILKQLSSTGDGLADAVDNVLQKKAVDALKKIG